jgi:hypothetical protein
VSEPANTTWVCLACGHHGQDRIGDCCPTKSELCLTESLEFNQGRVVSAEMVTE